MPDEVRVVMEHELDHDLSPVRIHADARAAKLSADLSANAFTIGRDIFFGRDNFQPETQAGRRLLAHEIAHVAQQPAAREDVIRREPIQDAAQEAVHAEGDENSTWKTPSEIANIIIEKARTIGNDATAVQFVYHVMEAPWEKARDLNAYGMKIFRKQLLADAFFQQITTDDLDAILSHAEGVSLVRYMASNLRSDHPTVAAVLGSYYGRLSEEAIEKVKKTDYPSGDFPLVGKQGKIETHEFAEYCMDAVLSNLEHAGGRHVRDEVVALANSRRDEEVARLTEELERENITQKVMEERIKRANSPLNSQNMNAAVSLGYARHVGVASCNKEECRKTLRHDKTAKPHREMDPFKFNGKDREPNNLFEKFYEPSPHRMLLDAIAGANAGIYMFGTSVAQRHSATILVEKLVDGPISIDSSDYKLYWNDQYNDSDEGAIVNPGFDKAKTDEENKAAGQSRIVKVDLGDGEHGRKKDIKASEGVDVVRASVGTIGTHMEDRDSLVKKIFYLNMTNPSNPNRKEFWRGEGREKRHEQYVTRDPNQDNGKTDIEKKAVRQRCSNTSGIEIWHITPNRR